MMRHMSLQPTEAPPREDSAVIEALEFDPEVPCEFHPDGVNMCGHRASAYLVTSCPCGTEALPICGCCVSLVITMLWTGQRDFKCFNSAHIVTHTVRFVPIK